MEIFEFQYQFWAAKPALLPDVLKGAADKRTDVAMRERVKELASEGAVEAAVGVLDIFITYQISPHHLELARHDARVWSIVGTLSPAVNADAPSAAHRPRIAGLL